MSAHAPPHAARGGAHVKSQLPPAQIAVPPLGVAQRVSHAPQFWAEVCRSTHAPPQLTLPSTQASEQAPSEQTKPGAHGLSQAPQWAGSRPTSTQALPHWRRGAAHELVQAPSTHAAVPAAASGQA